MSDASSSPKLRANYLSFFENLAQTLGAMTPSGGVALTIPLVFVNAGNGTWALYPFVMAAYLLIGLCLVEFAKRVATPGALYTYTGLGLGPLGGLIAGWAYVFALFLSIANALPSIALYAGVVLRRVAGVNESTSLLLVIMLVAALVAWWAAHRDIRLSTEMMLVIECVSVGTMMFLAILFLFRSGKWIDHDQIALVNTTPNGLKLGIVMAFMSLAAFESVTCLGDEAKDAKKTIPRVIFTCLLPLGLMYLFMAYVLVACFQGAPVSLSQAEAPFDQLALACNLPFFGTIVCGGVAMSFFACALGCTNAAARVLYSMAQNGHFFAPMGRAHPHNATPHRAIALIAVVAFLTPAVLLVSGIKLFDCIGYLAQISSFGYIVSYFLLTLAMPFYLLSVKAFRPWHIALLTATLLIVGFSIFGSLFPVPPAPWNYLPYIFAGIVGSGVVLSFSLKSRVKPDQS